MNYQPLKTAQFLTRSQNSPEATWERRRSERIPWKNKGTYILVAGRIRCYVNIIDMSNTGCALLSKQQFQPGTQAILRDRAGTGMKLIIEVKYARPVSSSTWKLGCIFSDEKKA